MPVLSRPALTARRQRLHSYGILAGVLCACFVISACSDSRWKEVVVVSNASASLRSTVWVTAPGNFLSVWTPDGARIWTSTDDGSIFYSPNGGSAWTKQKLGDPLKAPFQSIAPIRGSQDGSHIWALLNGNTILHSDDYGRTWSSQSDDHVFVAEDGTIHGLNSLFVSSDGHSVWIVGGGGRILHTFDAGAHWEQQASGTVEDFSAIRGLNGELWILARNGDVLHSFDTVPSWRLLYKARDKVNLQYLLGAGPNMWAIGRTADNILPDQVVYYSNDGGRTWTKQNSGEAGKGLKDIEVSSAFVSEGLKLWAATNQGTVISSGDKGRNWEIVRKEFIPEMVKERGGGWTGSPDIAISRLSSVFGNSNGNQLWAVGEPAVIFHSDNGGKDWTTQSGILDATARAVAASRDGTHIWLGNEEGDIFYSWDSGDTWQKGQKERSEFINSLFATEDGTRVWAVPNGEGILYSGDGGKTWTRTGVRAANDSSIPADPNSDSTPGFLYSISGTPTSSHVWAVGSNGAVFTSTDGTRWQKRDIPGSSRENLTGVFVNADGRRVVIAGAKQLFISDDSGSSWRIQELSWVRTVVGTPDGSTIWAFGGMLWKSVDGGRTWHSQALPRNVEIMSAHVGANQRSIWAVGNLGTETDGAPFILESADGGDTWNGIPESGEPSVPGVRQDASLRPLSIVGDASDRLWAVGEIGEIAGKAWVVRGLQSDYVYPAVQKWRYETGPLSTRLQFIIKPAPNEQRDGRPYTIILSGANDFDFAKNRFTALVVPAKQSSVNPALWSIDFDPRQMGIEHAQTAHLRISVESLNGFREELALPPFMVDPWGRWRGILQIWWVPPIAVVLLLLLSLTVLLFVRPALLLNFYRHAGFLRVAESVSVPWLSTLLRGLVTLTIVPYYVRHPRVLDAWVAANLNTLTSRFDREVSPHRENHGADRSSDAYVPLPVKIVSNQRQALLDRPSMRDLSEYFSHKRTIWQVVGPGGSGKTTLAVQIARWGITEALRQSLASHRMAPILVAEELSNEAVTPKKDLVTVIQRKLKNWLNEDVDRALVLALLKAQRLLVVVDGISERSDDTRDHIRTIHGSYPVNALVITSRTRLPFEAGDDVLMLPQQLDSSSLLYFMSALLRLSAPDEVLARMQQLTLAQQLYALLPKKRRNDNASGERYPEEQIPLTPLLVKLYINKAVELEMEGRPLTELPTSIPEIYFEFLRSVNAQTVRPSLPHDDMFRIAELLAELSLGEEFVPRAFTRTQARLALQTSALNTVAGVDAIQRLLDSGILLQRDAGTEVLLQFTVDPIGEYLAAMAKAKKCGSDRTCWAQLYSRVPEKNKASEGFQTALNLIVDRYAAEYGWAVLKEAS